MPLTPRWTSLRSIPAQQAGFDSPHRFNTYPCGRRSGKTELIGKRRLILRAMRGSTFPTPRYFAAAPTRDQAKRIYWADLKALVHPSWRRGDPSESELVIRLHNGAEVHVLGMDKPERDEGVGWDGGVLDEYANMKPQAWEAHVSPALSDRLGWCDFIGVPEGRNHYYELHTHAQTEMMEHGMNSEWGAYHWVSSLVLPMSEIEAAKRRMDPLTYQQEYEASFVNFQGQCYYPYSDQHTSTLLNYQPEQPLVLCFDFNVSPGVAIVCQEIQLPHQNHDQTGTAVIGEVHIPRNSNTPAVCRRLIQDWGEHPGPVYVYGDATGGARGTAKIAGSDWEIIEDELRGAYGPRLFMRVPRANPKERTRINAMNTRLLDGDGNVYMMVNPSVAPNLHRDLEGVRVLEGGSGEIDKRNDPKLSHASDALGYYIAEEFPIDLTDRVSTFTMDEIL